MNFISIGVFLVTLFGGFGTGGTGLIADGKLGYVTIYLDLELIPDMSVKQK